MKKVVYSLIGILAIAAQTTVTAQELLRRDTLRASVWFTTGSSSVDPACNGNEAVLDRLTERLRQLREAPATRITAVTIEGYASPDGTSLFNTRLAEARARNTANSLAARTALPESLFSVKGCGIDWEGLERAVDRSTELPQREAVLRILRHTPVWVIRDGKVVDGRKRQLGMLDGGRPYHALVDRTFPALRRADIRAAYTVALQSPPHRQNPENLIVKVGTPTSDEAGARNIGTEALPHPDDRAANRPTFGTSDPVGDRPDPAATADEETSARASDEARSAHVGKNPSSDAVPTAKGSPTHSESSERTPRIALKTNLLYDALLVPNIGLEYRFAERWSMTVDYVHAWWSRDSRHRYRRCYGGDLIVRRYFDERPFTGHHIGLFGSMLSYDFEFSGKGRQSDGFNFGGGFEYGYAFPVGRRLRIDCSIGLGYFGGRYKEYVPMDDCYVHERTRTLRLFGPARAEISLVWVLGHHRNTKGGAR